MAEYHVRIRELPADERPRERLRKYGAGTLSTTEFVSEGYEKNVSPALRVGRQLEYKQGGFELFAVDGL